MSQVRVEAVGGTTTLADRKHRAGQRMLIGFEGTGVTAELRDRIRRIRPAGFVLFARNVEEPRQVYELNRELASLCDAADPPLLAVDQEGGRVQRVRDTRWPAMRVVGQAEGHTAEVSRGIARELRAMGFNLNFAPVCDVDSNPANPVIGDRSFGRRAEVVSRHAVEFLRAHQAEGVIACAKHFPGHGDTDVDSHLDLPKVERDRGDIEHLELPPFEAAVVAGVATVMTAHVLFPAWDEDLPATLSPTIVPTLLRQRMGFGGVVFSDDLDMKAVRGRWSARQQVDAMSRATVDVLLCCQTTELQEEVYDELVRSQERDKALHDAASDAVDRVDELRRRFLSKPPHAPDLQVVGSAEHRDLAMLVNARGGAA